MTLRASISLLVASALSLGGLGCHSDGLYDPCPLSNSIKDACNKASSEGQSCDESDDCQGGLTCMEGTCSDGTAYSCVVAEHPFCLERICASWQGAAPVCTRACESDDDCPGSGSCVSHQGLDFCIDGASQVEQGVFDRLSELAGCTPSCWEPDSYTQAGPARCDNENFENRESCEGAGHAWAEPEPVLIPGAKPDCDESACNGVDDDCDGSIDEDAGPTSGCGEEVVDGSQGGCRAIEWTCITGECISATKFCDGTEDCVDGSDEALCPDDGSQGDCLFGQLMCGSGECISPDWICDGVMNCPDGSDEFNCDD